DERLFRVWIDHGLRQRDADGEVGLWYGEHRDRKWEPHRSDLQRAISLPRGRDQQHRDDDWERCSVYDIGLPAADGHDPQREWDRLRDGHAERDGQPEWDGDERLFRVWLDRGLRQHDAGGEFGLG